MTSIIAKAQRIDLILLYAPVSHGQKCEEGHFACPSGNCISSVWLCDGQKDCEDGADEFQCGKSTCFKSEKWKYGVINASCLQNMYSFN